MALMTSIHKTCLTIRAKPVTGYASSCVKLEGLMDKNTHQVVFNCYPTEVDIFQDAAFTPFKNVCDAVFKPLHANSVGAEVKATPVMNPDDECKLWISRVLSLSTPLDC